jgi:cellulose synthase/poly-beta-1,6-N-acetylglucosamine synthase-like glycosyltransferase
METFLLVFAVMSGIILVFHIALGAGMVRNRRDEKRLATRAERPAGAAPVAEVIVALRNEETTVGRLLESLRAQTLPGCLFLMVDDRSTDATARLLDDFCASVGPRARVVHNDREPDGLTGKQAALDIAFSMMRGEILLFTDGDCQLTPTWAEEMVRHFDGPRVGVVLGRIEIEEGASFLERFQSFEQPLLNAYNFGSVGIGIPTGCFGNNMAIRASAVKAAGGFHALGYSVTEDAMLLDAVARTGGFEVKACTSARAAAVTVAKTRWGAYVDQHTRWNAGGLFSADIVTRVSYIFVVLIYLVGSVLVLPLGFVDWRVPVLSANAFLSIGILAFLGGLEEGKDRARYFVRFLPYVLFFGFFYSFITVRAFLRRPFEWKGAELTP